jgi:hypothetical protein
MYVVKLYATNDHFVLWYRVAELPCTGRSSAEIKMHSVVNVK